MIALPEGGLLAIPLVAKLVVPLAKLLATMAVSLVVAQALETFRWTAFIGRLASPLIRFARLTPLAGAAFSLSFVSSASANAMLGESFSRGALTKKELLLANIVNSAPAFFVHLPSMLATAFAFLGSAAGTYVGLVFLASWLRTVGAACIGHFLLPPPVEKAAPVSPKRQEGALPIMFRRFRKRLYRICLFTVPVYCLVFALQQAGVLTRMETFFAAHATILSFLHPGTVSIVALYLLAEGNAAFAAAAALLHGGNVSPDQAILALLVGNIVSSPMRAFRHQLPSYSGFFSPGTALFLVGINQSIRAAALILVSTAFYFVCVAR